MTCSTFILVYYAMTWSANLVLNAENDESCLEILHKSFKECHEVLRSPDVPRYSFL